MINENLKSKASPLSFLKYFRILSANSLALPQIAAFFLLEGWLTATHC